MKTNRICSDKDILLCKKEEILHEFDKNCLVNLIEDFLEICERILGSTNKEKIYCCVSCASIFDAIKLHINNIGMNNLYNRDRLRAVFEIIKDNYSNDYHEIKRSDGFSLFDKHLDSCWKGVCPVLTQEQHYCLTDISIDGYAEKRAFYYSIDSIGKDDRNRYEMSVDKLQVVFNCKKLSTLNPTIFEEDIRQIQEEYCEKAKKRKAFWCHLSDQTKDHLYNYHKSCSFINEIKNNRYNLYRYKNLILDNSNQANAIDLFRLCHIRKMCRLNQDLKNFG